MMMKKSFDPTEVHRMLLSDIGYEWQLERNFDNSRKSGGLSSSAHADLGVAVQCILVGLGDAATQLLAKARLWATEAIVSENEPAIWMTYQTLVMCDWILGNGRNSNTYMRFNELINRLLEDPVISNDAVNVSLMMPGLLDCRSYERVVYVFEQAAQFVEPVGLDRISNEAQLCFVIARHRLGGGYAAIEVDKACDKFMLNNMDRWLVNGHAVRACQWLKIIWENRGDTQFEPRDIVLKCYDYLKKCNRPV